MKKVLGGSQFDCDEFIVAIDHFLIQDTNSNYIFIHMKFMCIGLCCRIYIVSALNIPMLTLDAQMHNVIEKSVVFSPHIRRI